MCVRARGRGGGGGGARVVKTEAIHLSGAFSLRETPYSCPPGVNNFNEPFAFQSPSESDERYTLIRSLKRRTRPFIRLKKDKLFATIASVTHVLSTCCLLERVN